MLKRRGTAIRLTSQHDANLQRFGCALDTKTGTIIIDWRSRNLAAASRAEIVACVGRLDDNSIVFLALEVSAIRPIPDYCYYPFDLEKPIHREYLERLTKSGEIKICLLSDEDSVYRVHKLPPYFLSRSADAYQSVLCAKRTSAGSERGHEQAIEGIERWVRIPQFLEHLLFESDVREILVQIKETADSATQEDKELAKRIATEANDVLQRYSATVGGYGTFFKSFRSASLAVDDCVRLFFNDEKGLLQFWTDVLGGTCSQTELKNIRRLVKVLGRLAIFLPREQSKQNLVANNELPKIHSELPGLIEQMTSGKGVSLNLVAKLLRIFEVPVTSAPGRPPSDYSREYDNRVLFKKSWSEVTRQALDENPELRAEYDGRGWDALDSLEREKVRNRVRQGVTTYAKRMGKPLPPPREEADSSSDGGEEKPPISLQVK
ncbi:MAG TPA: hypothetical protein VGR94_09640 [Candidatus Acidoferrales bacterium]|nr:hypothetical protein [Candidatus Acidoferrales bacterium]